MDIVAFIVAIALGIAAGAFVVKRARQAGKGAVTRWAGAGVVGIVVWFSTFGVALEYIAPETTIAGDQMPADAESQQATLVAGEKAASAKRESTTQDQAQHKAEQHLSIATDELESRVNTRLEDLGSNQILRLHRAEDGDFVGSSSANDAVIMGTTPNEAYITNIAITFYDDGGEKSNAKAKAIGSAMIATTEDASLTTAQAVYDNLVDNMARKGYGTAELDNASYRLTGSTPPAILTIKPK